jgi:hypothetical protein
LYISYCIFIYIKTLSAIRRKEFVVNILEGVISRKKALGCPRIQYLEQVARNIGADNSEDGKVPTNQKTEG